MSARAAPKGAHTDASRRVPGLVPARAGLALSGLALLAACGDDGLRRVDEQYAVVGGAPGIDPSLPTIDRAGGDAKPSDFGSNAPVQVDVFLQTQVPKVDVLWVIDNSGSMSEKQTKVRNNFQAFVAKLVESNSNIDYHIGVVTTDTYNPGEAGKLQNRAGLTKPWIGKDTCSGSCDPVDKFRLNASVGIGGSGDEKGLLAAMMALSPPLATTGANAGFLRQDAALFLIILSDEEDSSCAPVREDFGGGCNNPVSYGTPQYYTRFFEGLKGFGRSDLVTVGTIVALTRDNVGQGVVGCRSATNSQDIAVHAPRYIAVAEGTGGLATSICDGDYLPALQNLGFLATGAKSSFLLSRAPYADQISVLVRLPNGTRTPQVRGTHYDYEPCASGGGVLNAIRFKPTALPPAGATIEVEYPVNVRGVTCP